MATATPPHSWALALYNAGDYAKAGVPMMPVVKGARSTRLQILVYSLVLAPLAYVPVLTGLGGLIYAWVAAGGGALFVLLAIRLSRSKAGDADAAGDGVLYGPKPDAKPARDLFAVSILYLFALFAALLVEHGLRSVL